MIAKKTLPIIYFGVCTWDLVNFIYRNYFPSGLLIAPSLFNRACVKCFVRFESIYQFNMLRSILVVILVCTSLPGIAQVETQVHYNDREVNVSKDTIDKILSAQTQVMQDSLGRISQPYDLQNEKISLKRGIHQLEDSLNYNSLEQKKYFVADSLLRLSSLNELGDPRDISSFRQVYSERAIKVIYDSLGMDKFDRLPVNEITEEDLLILVNDKFSSQPLLEKSDSVMENALSADDLSKQRLAQSSLSELTPLTGQVMKSEYFEKLDSIRNVNLQAQGLELKERAVSEFGKVAELKKELTFWDKSYFEGIIGIANTEQFFVQLSPAMGYHFLKDLSFGIGPIVHLYEDNKKKMMAVGVRPFFKQEFLKQRAYLQAEYVMNPSFDNAETIVINKHNALVGGGVLFPISRSVAVNFCVMHRFDNHITEVSNVASWTFRIGISSMKAKE